MQIYFYHDNPNVMGFKWRKMMENTGGAKIKSPRKEVCNLFKNIF